MDTLIGITPNSRICIIKVLQNQNETFVQQNKELSKTHLSNAILIEKLQKENGELREGLQKIFNIGHKPYRNTRNEEIEIIYKK